jgi:signal transduction histidine kinase/ligand-binding sensor domain-containing protein
MTLRLAKGFAHPDNPSMAMNRRTPARIIRLRRNGYGATMAATCGLWLAVCLAAFPAVGGGRYCVVDGWGAGEGLLPQSSIISMAQTRDGYLWLGTRNGLARFDGVHFTVFDESNTPQLSSIQIVKLFEDSRGNLWIGTESAGAMLVTNGQIIKLNFGQGRRQGHLVSICEDALGAIWLLTEDRELARYLNGNVDVWNIAGESWAVGRAVIAEKSGLVWVGTDHSMIAIDPAAVRSKEPLPETARAPVGQLDFLLASRSGGYWRIADGMIQKCAGTNVEKNFGPCPWIRNPDTVRAACEDRDGNLIVGTHGQGVFWFDDQGRATHISTTNGLANDSVLSLVMDTDGSLWVGMDGGGRADRSLNRVTRSIFNLLDSSSGLVIQSICEDNKGGLWFSPKDNDFCYWKDGVVSRVGSSPGPMSEFNPKAVLVDASQEVWAATVGVNLFRLQDNEFVPAPGVGVLNPEISALYQGHGGRLWVGTQGGLGCWNGQQWQTFTTNNGLSANIVRAIADDAGGDVWVGTEHGGLNLLRDGKFTSFRRTDGFPSDNISCLYLDASGVLWIGTIGNGLIRMAGGQWKHYTTQNGLTGNSIDYLIEDGDGFLWIGSNAGLMRVRKKDLDDFDPDSLDSLSCRGYDKKDGLPATECTFGSQPAACRTHDGVLWFPTIAGMVSVNPSEIKPNTNPPPVVIEAVRVDGQPQSTNGLRTPLPASVTVPAGAENLEIDFTSLNLAAAGRALFCYQLEGYQTKLTPAGKDRFARYPNLPHGSYRFKVEARNEDGIWNQIGASLDVIVLPPFWQTWWFRVIAAGSLLGIIIFIVQYVSTQKLQRQLAGLRQQQALEKERARIARDIHDQVGASLTQLSLLGEMVQAGKDNPEEAETHARQITQTARETARELDEIVWTVNPSNDTLDGLINYICKNAQEYLAVAGLRYRLDVPTQLPALAISPEARHNVFLAAKEAVTNVVRHARASEAWLRLRLDPPGFTLEIEDNGRGPDGLKEKAAEARNGLRNMRKRMEDIGGEFFIGPGQQGGTLVRLTVPLRNR